MCFKYSDTLSEIQTFNMTHFYISYIIGKPCQLKYENEKRRQIDIPILLYPPEAAAVFEPATYAST